MTPGTPETCAAFSATAAAEEEAMASVSHNNWVIVAVDGPPPLGLRRRRFSEQGDSLVVDLEIIGFSFGSG